MEKLLKQLNFTKNEVKVYTSLIKTGGCTMTELAKLTKLKRSSTQEYIKSLINKGFIVASRFENTFYYQSEDPDKIRQIINERLFVVDKLIESLNVKEIKQDKWQVRTLDNVEAEKLAKKMSQKLIDTKKTKIYFNTKKIIISSKNQDLPFLEISSPLVAGLHKNIKKHI